MTASFDHLYISAEDYLEGERLSPIRHEYIRGLVYAMAGASKFHDIIAGNVFSLVMGGALGSVVFAKTV